MRPSHRGAEAVVYICGPAAHEFGDTPVVIGNGADKAGCLTLSSWTFFSGRIACRSDVDDRQTRYCQPAISDLPHL